MLVFCLMNHTYPHGFVRNYILRRIFSEIVFFLCIKVYFCIVCGIIVVQSGS